MKKVLKFQCFHHIDTAFPSILFYNRSDIFDQPTSISALTPWHNPADLLVEELPFFLLTILASISGQVPAALASDRWEWEGAQL